MNESQCFGVECLPGENVKAIINELFVFAVESPFTDAVSAITYIAKEGVPEPCNG